MRVTRLALPILLALASIALLTEPAHAAAGDLDPTFGDGGKLWTIQIGLDFLRAGQDVALQQDGKIVVVGTASSSQGDEWYFALVRYDTNGSVDNGFGHGGGVVSDLGQPSFARAVAIQPDGKILAGGDSPCPRTSCFTVARYNPDGSLDGGFGTGGVVRTKFNLCGCEVDDLAIQADGKIVAVGWQFIGGDANDDTVFGIARYNLDGSLDQGFGTLGKVSLNFGYGLDLAWGVAIQADQKIVVAGEGAANFYRTGSDFAVARLNTDGTLDTSFAGDGMKTINLKGTRWDRAGGVAIQADGKIVMAGSSYVDFAATDPRFVAARLNSDGSRDFGFGRAGRVVTAVGGFGGYAQAVAMYPSGKILAAGRSFADGLQDSSAFTVVRYTPDGKQDPTWGSNGVVVTSFGSGADVANSLAVQSDGKVVAAGEVYTYFGLARYLGDA